LKQDSCLPKKTKINYFLVAILFVIGTMFSISFSCFNNTKIGAEVSATEVTSVEGTEANKPVFHFDEENENLEGEPILGASGTSRTYTVSILYTDDNINYYPGSIKTVGSVTTAHYKNTQSAGGVSDFTLGSWSTNASSYSGGGDPDFYGFWQLLYCAKATNSNYVLYGWENDATLPHASNPGQGSSLNKSTIGGENNVYYIGSFDLEQAYNSYHYYAIFKNKNIPDQEPVEPEEDELVIVRIQGANCFTPTTVGVLDPWAVNKGTYEDNEGIENIRVSINGGVYQEWINFRDLVPHNSNIRVQITFSQGYKFDKWVCDASVSGFSASQQNLNVTLNAKQNMYGQPEIEFWPQAKKNLFQITTVSNYSDNGVNFLLNNETGGSVYVDSVGNSLEEFDAGAGYTIYARPNAGYVFKGWYEIVTPTNHYYPIKKAEQCTLSNGVYSMGATVSNPGSNKTYQAVFIKEYTITIEADEGVASIRGGIGSRNFYAGQQLIDYINYDPNSSINAIDSIFEVELKTGIKWDTWEHISGTLPTGFVLKSQSQSTNLTMPAFSFSIKAKTSVSATNYIKLIAVTSENGVLSYNDTIVKGGQVKYFYNAVQSEPGTTVSAKVMATDKIYMWGSASEGYRFLGWYKTISGNDYYDLYSDSNSTFLQSEEMPASNENGVTLLTYYAIFEKEYALTINKDSGISSVTGAGSYIYNEEININATLLPDRLWTGWKFVSGVKPEGLIEGINGDMQQTIIIGRGDVVIEATSSLYLYGLTVIARYTDAGTYYNEGGGTVRIGDGAAITKASKNVELNASVLITAKANVGYKFLGWYKNVTDDGYSEPLNAQNPTATTVSTEAMIAGEEPFQEDVLVYYAIFAKEYIYQFIGDFGIASQIPAGAKTFYYGQEINISATVKNDYDWAQWKVVSGVSPIGFDANEREQTITVGGGNCTIRAITTYTTLANYALATTAKYTNVTDNQTLILGQGGGTLTAPVTEVQYGNQTTLTATALEGFELFGIYKYDVNTIMGNTPWRTGAECTINGRIYTTLTDPMTESGQHYYAVFKRVEYTVTTDTATGTSINVNGLVDNKAYFGQVVNYEAFINAGYENLSVKVYKTGTSELVVSTATKCTMPAFAITIKVTATPVLYTITYNANDGAFSPELYSGAIDINGNMVGGAYYETSNYIYYMDSNKLIVQNGVPTPNWVGYKIVSWNTQADGNGINYITYSQAGVPTYEEWDNLAGGTLYAIYELADFDYEITQYTDEFTYDGLKHDVLRIDINNFIEGKVYLYKWINSENVVVAETESSLPYNTLQLRSVNQSDVYCCEISIIGEAVAERTTNYSVEILKQALTLSLGDEEIIGDFAISYKESDLAGLVANHIFVSGYSIFKSGKVDVTYSEAQNKGLIVSNIILKTLSQDTGLVVTEEDGIALIENYEINYDGQIIIISPFDFAHLMAGTYERTVDEETFEDILDVDAMTNVDFDMSFGAGFTQDETYTLNGIQHNYIDITELPSVLTINITSLPESYKFYKLYINNTEIINPNFSVDANGVVSIVIDVTQSLVLEDLDEFYYINVSIYLTKQALVTYDYGFEEEEISGNYATFDGVTERILEFNSPFVRPEDPTRTGFIFKGWFYDNDVQVGDIWKKTGETTVYAKWELAPITQDLVTIIVYDNDEVTYTYTRDYNGNLIRLDYALSSFNPVINYSVIWSKFNNISGLYINIATPNNIKNVADSGQYSFSINATYGTSSKYLSVGLKTVQITILPVNVDLTEEITKIYDATTNLSNNYFVEGVNGEQLKLKGNYVSADVNVVDDEISPIALTNLGIENYSGAIAGNYNLNTTEYSGLITPYIYEINENLEKVYDGNIYTAEISRNVVLKGVTQIVTFTLETTGVNSGIYTSTATENKLLLQGYSIKNLQNDVISSDNYEVIFNDATSLVINKADLSNVKLSEKSVVYNGEQQINSVTNLEGSEYDSENLPENVARIDYYIDGQLTSGVTNAGIYEVTAKIISNNQNYNDMQLTARFIIEKATLSFEFLNNGEVLAESYAYTGTDIIDNLTIDVTNVSGTEVTPQITKLVKRYGVEVLSVLVMGNYTIEAIFDTTNFEPAELNGHIREFSISTGGAIENVIFNDATTTYAGINLAESFVSGNLILPEGISSNSYTITLDGQSVPVAKNVGVYTIRANLVSEDESIWTLEQNYIEATLTIVPFVIINTNVTIYAVKNYDGTTALPANSRIEITLSGGRTENLGITGSFASANTGFVQIDNLQLLDYQNNLKDNYEIDEEFIAYGTIEKKVLNINLYKDYFNETYNTYIQVAYTGNNSSFTLDTDNNTTYVEGLVNNEYIFGVFETLGKNAGKYAFSDTITEGNYTILVNNELTVYDSEGTAIIDGRDNYLITIRGGLEIVQLYVSAELTGQQDAVYNGEAINFGLILTLHNVLTGINLSQEYNYSYDTNTFVLAATSEVIPATQLAAEIKLGQEVVTEMMNAGVYSITLFSEDSSYLFNTTRTNQIALQFEVAKAEIVFDFGELAVVYGNELSYTNETAFIGEKDDEFFVTLSYNTSDRTNFIVGNYDLATLITSRDYTIETSSTGDINNYQVSIVGTLAVTPRLLQVNETFDELDLAYNGTNQIETVNNCLVGFIDVQDDANPIVLNLGTEYFVECCVIYSDGENQVRNKISEFKNSGYYYYIISSINYRFDGGIDNVNGRNEIIFEIYISPANSVIINLDTVKIAFTGEPVTYDINIDNSAIVSGLINDEYLVCKIATSGSEAGVYSFGETAPNCYIVEQYTSIYDRNGNEIVNGFDNYAGFIIDGEIEIVKLLTTVEIIISELDEGYNGFTKDIIVNLSTEQLDSEEPEVVSLTYDYVSMQFYNGAIPVSREQLSLYIFDKLASVDNKILNAGAYTLILQSEGQTPYVFASSGDFTHVEDNIVVDKCVLDAVTIYPSALLYGHEFVFDYASANTQITGVNGEVFYLDIFGPDATAFNVGMYTISSTQESSQEDNIINIRFDYADTPLSTGLLENYVIQITGSLEIKANELVVNDLLSDLRYNGTDRKDQIKDDLIIFKEHHFQDNIINLVYGEDYEIKYYSDSQRTTEITSVQNVGTYYLRILATNYKLLAEEDAIGEYANNQYYIDFDFEIYKADVTLYLCDPTEDPYTSYILMPYTDSDVTITIDKNLWLAYDGSAVNSRTNNTPALEFNENNGEYIVFTIKTYANTVGAYEFYEEAEAGKCYIDGDIVVYDISDQEIVNGLNNYQITVYGGIQVVNNMTIVEFIGIDNLVYTGLNHDITVKLTTPVITSGDPVVEILTYNYVEQQFYNDTTPLGQDLTITLKSDRATELEDPFVPSTTNGLKYPNLYNVVLTSSGSTPYSFATSGTSTYSTTIYISPAQITFDVGEVNILRGEADFTTSGTFTGVNNETFDVTFSNASDVSTLLAGTYTLINKSKATNELIGVELSLNEGSTGELINYNVTITGTLIVQSAGINVSHRLNDIELIYNGKNQSVIVEDSILGFADSVTGTKLELIAGEDYFVQFGYYETPESSSYTLTTEVKNAQNYVIIVSSKNYTFEGGEENVDGEGTNIITFNFAVSPAILEANLYSNNETLEYLLIPFTGTNDTFEITIENYSDYISNLQNGEQVSFVIKTESAEAGEYQFESNPESLPTYPDIDISYLYGEISVYDSQGNLIVNGHKNYILNGAGGIKISKYVSDVTFLNPVYTYDGTAQEITIMIDTEIGETTESETLVYDYATSQFMKDAQAIEVNKLSLLINGKPASLTNTIKNVGTYTLTLISGGQMPYTFASSNNNIHVETGIIVNKADLTIDLGDQTVPLRHNFSYKGTFPGLGEDVFNLIFYNSRISSLNTGTYSINTEDEDSIQLFYDYDYSKVSTGDLNNYIIKLDGTLTVTPRELTVIDSYAELELVYNGLNQINAVKNMSLSFTDTITQEAVSLVFGQDYDIYYPVNEFIDAGTYVITIRSGNYKLTGNETAGEADTYYFINYNVTIAKAPLNILLYDEYTNDGDSENDIYLRSPYTGSPVTVQINKDNNYKYIFGTVNNEYLVIDFLTMGADAGSYPFSTEPTENNSYFSGEYRVFDSQGFEIIGGSNNYEVSVQGGIEIVENLTTVEFEGLEELIYSGKQVPIRLTLTTEDVILNETIVQNFVYDYAKSQFIQNGVEIDSDILMLKINELVASTENVLKNTGTYTITLISNNGEFIFEDTLNNSFEETTEIGKADIVLDLGTIIINYGEVLEYANELPFIGENNEEFYLSISCDTKELDVLNSPYLFSEIENIDFDYNEDKISADNLKENYNVLFEGVLIIEAREIEVIADYDALNLVYNAENQIETVRNVSVSFKDVATDETIALEVNVDYSLTYSNILGVVTEITNAGTYFATFSSSNYKFVDSILSGNNFKLVRSFVMQAKEITVNFTIEEDLVYNNEAKNPVSYEFEGAFEGSNLNELLLYSNGQVSVKNAGTYTASINISNSNYVLTGETESQEFTILPYGIVVEEPTEIYFSKHFGENDPILIRDITLFNEIIVISFDREAGEQVGRYALTNPSLQLERNNNLILNNYEITNAAEFVDNFKAFEIIAFDEETGTLTIKQISNIITTYDATSISSLDFANIAENFIVEHNGQQLSANEYDLTAIFTFVGYESVRNVGNYTLALSEVSSTSHLGEITFESNGFEYIIQSYELDVEKLTVDNITKQYDQLANISVDGILSLVTVFEDDIESVQLQAVFIDEDGHEAYNVGDYVIFLSLTGDMKDNYFINPDCITAFTGSIVAREITVAPAPGYDESAFDKEYDKTSAVNTGLLVLVGVLSGDYVAFSGEYLEGDYDIEIVGTDYDIEFTIDNPNYVIVDEGYKGDINTRQLTISENSVLTKTYDGTTELDIALITLERIISGDEVALLEANFVEETEGVHYIDFALNGKDALNYHVEDKQGEILSQFITVKFHYGDEDGVYIYNFVADGKLITKPQDEYNVIYGTSLNDIRNGMLDMPIGIRDGYTQAGWFTDTERTDEFLASTIIDFNLAELADNEYFLDLYADWTINTYEIVVEIQTEEIANKNFKVNAEGGRYTIDTVEQYDARQTFLVNYYAEPLFAFIASENFTFDGLYAGITKITDEQTVVLSNVTENLNLVIKFARNTVQVQLNLETSDTISGLTNDWNYVPGNATALRDVKFGETIILPSISRIGYSLMGYALTSNGDLEYSTGLGMSLTPNDSTELYAVWDVNSYKVYFDYTGGAETVAYERALEDENGTYIVVDFGSAIGELPQLSLNGYEQGDWLIKLNNNIIASEITTESVWTFANVGNYTLTATWTAGENTFEITSALNTNLYTQNEINDYDEYEDAIEFTYKINDVENGIYNELFTAQTGDTVQIDANIISPYYEFLGWKINETTLISGNTYEIDGVTYQAYGEILIITNFAWGAERPTILAEYTPFAVEILQPIYNANGGTVELVSGFFEVDGVNYTLTGALLAISYSVNENYHLEDFTITNADFTEEENNTVIITNFYKEIGIEFNFVSDTYNFTIEITGETDGVSDLMYSINDSEYVQYTEPAQIHKFDTMKVKLIVNYGYVSTSWQLSDGGDNITLTELMSWIEGDKTVIENEIFDFDSAFTLTINLDKLIFDVSTNCAILTNDTYELDTIENQSMVTDSEGTEITSATYLTDVTFKHIIFAEDLIHETNISAEKYDFIGWFELDGDHYILISDMPEYTFAIESDVNSTAVFKLKTFELTYNIANDASYGKVVDSEGDIIPNVQYVNYGDLPTSEMIAEASNGCTFSHWNITYTYNGETVITTTLDTATLQPEDISGIANFGLRSDVNLEAVFVTKDIDVNIYAQFVDGSDATEKITVSYGSETGQTISASGKTYEDEFIVTASTAQEGYTFINWQVIGEYRVTTAPSQVYENGKLVGSTIGITFIGEGNEDGEYSIIANFDSLVYTITTSVIVEGGEMGGGEVFAEQDNPQGQAQLRNPSRVGTTVEIFVYIKFGYNFDIANPESWLSVANSDLLENVVITVEELELNSNLQNLFSKSFKISLSEFISDINITIDVNRDITTFIFKDKVDDNWVTCEFTATIKYDTNEIIIDDINSLILSRVSYAFKGWSVNSDILDIYITATGELNFFKWQNPVPEITLFAMWEELSVKLNVEVEPLSAPKSTNYYSELFGNLLEAAPVQLGNEYYFAVGSTFGISLPSVEEKFSFIAYEVLIPNEQGGFEWDVIPAVYGVTEFDRELFTISAYEDYIYSNSNGSGIEVSAFEDGTIYIKLIYGIKINVVNKNYYDSGNNAEIGGASLVNGKIVNNAFRIGETVSLDSVPANGYLFRNWNIGGVEFDEESIDIVVDENTTCEAVYVGKPVQVIFKSNARGAANDPIGGNIELKEGIEHYHVGDVLYLSATANAPHVFNNVWEHNITGQFTSNKYIITATDGVEGVIELEPLFSEAQINLSIEIEGSQGTVISSDITLEAIPSENKVTYSATLDYDVEISITISANEKFKYASIWLIQGTEETNVSHLVSSEGILSFTPSHLGVVDELVFKIRFEKLYWYDYIVEKGFVTVNGEEVIVNQDFIGSGKASDPYLITNIDDYALWAYVINNNVVQQDSDKLPYNTDKTYYKVINSTIFNERYWTPIGTSENPFRGHAGIYADYAGITVDVEDANYPMTMFDEEVLEEYNNLFGYLAETAVITFEAQSNMMLIIIIALLLLIIILLVIIILNTVKKRKRMLSSVYQSLDKTDINNDYDE